MDGDLEALKAATVAGSKFVEDYHIGLQKKDGKIVPSLRDYSVVLWNGHKITGRNAIVDFFSKLPSCSIWQSTIDVQILECLFYPLCVLILGLLV